MAAEEEDGPTLNHTSRRAAARERKEHLARATRHCLSALRATGASATCALSQAALATVGTRSPRTTKHLIMQMASASWSSLGRHWRLLTLLRAAFLPPPSASVIGLPSHLRLQIRHTHSWHLCC